MDHIVTSVTVDLEFCQGTVTSLRNASRTWPKRGERSSDERRPPCGAKRSRMKRRALKRKKRKRRHRVAVDLVKK